MGTAALRRSESLAFPQPREMPKKRKRLTVVTPRQREMSPTQRKRRPQGKERTRTAVNTKAKTMCHAKAVTRTRSRVRVIYWLVITSVTVATVVLLMTSLLRYNELSGLNRDIRETAAQVENLRAQQDTLAMQLAPYIEASRIEDLAKRRLGMRYPSKEQVLSAVRDPAMTRKDRTASVFEEKTTIAASPQHKE